MALTNYVIGTTAHPGSTTSIQDAMTQEGYRYLDLAMLMEGATGSSQLTQARAGVLTAGSLDATSQAPNAMGATAAGSGLSINIARGAAVVERGTPDGPYLVSVFSNGQVTLGTADATNSRVDRVDLQVLDGSLGDNGGTSQTAYIVTPGSGAPVSGVIPVSAAPANSIPICQVTLPANTVTVTNAMITKTRKSSALRGAIRVLLEGDSLSDPGMHVGEMRDTSAINPASPTIDRWNTDTVAWERVIDLLRVQAHYTPFISSQTVNPVNTTTYTALTDTSGNSVGHAFVAPASGIVEIIWGANAFSGISGSSLLIGTAVRTGGVVGSGTIVSDVSDDEAVVWSVTGSSADTPGSRTRLVTGLTPGSTYNVRQSGRNSGSTSSHVDRPWVITKPVAF